MPALLTACGGGSSANHNTVSTNERVVLSATGGSTPDAAKLEATARIMQQRLRALGTPDAVVKVAGTRLVATGTGVKTSAAHALQRGRLEFRPVLAIVPSETPSGPVGDSADVVLSSRPSANGMPPIRYSVGSAALTGTAVRDAKAQFLGSAEGWVIDLALSHQGATTFNQLAAVSFPRSPPENEVAIVLDGVVQSAPSFQTDSFNGDVEISGTFTETEAKDLAGALKYGALPVPLRIAHP